MENKITNYPQNPCGLLSYSQNIKNRKKRPQDKENPNTIT